MKKLFKTILALLPMAMLVGCASTNVEANIYQAQEPTIAEHNTYLVLTANGRYNGEMGENIPDLFLENTIKFAGEANSALPGKDVVTSIVDNVEFVSWIKYENKGKPTVYDKVPTESDSILYAFFKNTAEPKPEEGGGTTPDPDTDPDIPVTEKVTVYLDDCNYQTMNIHAWGGEGVGDMSTWPGTQMTKVDNYFKFDLPTKYTGFLFNHNGDEGKTSNMTTANITEERNCYHYNHKQWGKLGDTLDEIPTTMVYCNQKPVDWRTDVYAYAWGASGNNGEWPGQKMTAKDGYWEYEIVKGLYDHVVFNDGKDNSKKTADLDYDEASLNNCYHIASKTWGKLEDLVEQDNSLPKSEYFLVGKGSFIAEGGEEFSTTSGIVFYENTKNSNTSFKEYVAFNVKLEIDDDFAIKSEKSGASYYNFVFDHDNAVGRGQIGQLEGSEFAKCLFAGTYTFYFKVFNDISKTPEIIVK